MSFTPNLSLSLPEDIKRIPSPRRRKTPPPIKIPDNLLLSSKKSRSRSFSSSSKKSRSRSFSSSSKKSRGRSSRSSSKKSNGNTIPPPPPESPKLRRERSPIIKRRLKIKGVQSGEL